MLIKNMQKVNRIQALGHDGQLTDTVINLDWINAKLQYSWAEGPVMCKRNGYYFYFPAGDVSGGQYVLRTKNLTSDSTKWERLGDFFKPVTDSNTGFRRPNHISAPLQLPDGTWWTIGQSYEKYPSDDWSGTGRQTSLYPVTWEGDRPWGMASTTNPVTRPDLPSAGIPWRSVHSDSFDDDTLGNWWHFLTRPATQRYSLKERKGWLRLSPDTARTHVLQKETDHFYAAVTRVDLDAKDTSAKAGIYLTNGNQQVNVRLYTGFDQGKKIIFAMDIAIRSIPNKTGHIVWLKLVREKHDLSAWYSPDGNKWTAVGNPISSIGLDKTQPNYNSWVGTSIGLFAEGQSADFDFFICKDGFTPIPAISAGNFFGIQKLPNASLTNNSALGGWFMISGVQLGHDKTPPSSVKLQVESSRSAQLELWIDDLGTGKKIATIPVQDTRGQWSDAITKIPAIAGAHDIFIKFPTGTPQTISIKSIQFLK
jgi:hypothetical protein